MRKYECSLSLVVSVEMIVDIACMSYKAIKMEINDFVCVTICLIQNDNLAIDLDKKDIQLNIFLMSPQKHICCARALEVPLQVH